MKDAGAGFKERIDMAVFGPIPDFVRISIRLTADQDAPIHGRGVRAASALLASMSADAVVNAEDADRRFLVWRRAYGVFGLPDSTIPPPEALLGWARAMGGVPSQGLIEDLVNAFALEHYVPAAVYDLAAVEGDLWLRPSRGHEHFEPATGTPTNPDINELILADSGDRVVAMAWHGVQSAATRARPNSTDILVHVDLLEHSPKDARGLSDSLEARLGGFAGGKTSSRLLHRDQPMVSWPE